MENYEEDTNHSFGTILFIILFLLFAFTFSDKSDCQASISLPYSLQIELTSEHNSSRFDAIIFNAVPFPVFIKTSDCTLHNTNLNLFDLQYKISDYNRRIAHNIILLQKTRFSIESVPLWRFCFHLPLSENEDIPVLG